MDLSSIPLEVLRAEVEAYDAMKSSAQVGLTPICQHAGWNCAGCPLHSVDCGGLLDDAPGWSERKERYLLAIRAEIAERTA